VLRTTDLEYDLPSDLVATAPASPRDSARMLVVRRSDPGRVDDLVVRDLPGLISPGDLLVFNETKVLPARFVGHRTDTGAKAQGLYLAEGPEPSTWVVLIKTRRFRPGAVIRVEQADGSPAGTNLTLISPAPGEPGAWIVRVSVGDAPIHPGGTPCILERIGLTPLPPYILAARKERHISTRDEQDRRAYQTVYAGPPGSVAAPTAGLHFTPELLQGLAAAGVRRAGVVLHVGIGTFKPVETAFVEEHPIHAEWCSMPAATHDKILDTRRRGARVIPVGTTSARTIESFARAAPAPSPDASGSAWLSTRLLITPGFEWRWTDGLLTNFHLPCSTLMALVAALLPGGAEGLKRLYTHAIERRYRFYSYGDAMLILP
jgi:S-adenosylmethionine:tRNA ribosyltransferase-isomerase